MHSVYVFNFLKTVSLELKASLDEKELSVLNDRTLQALVAYQQLQDLTQGVYLLHYNNLPVYIGKADNVRERLSEHLIKLSGRRGIDLGKVGYKALLLDRSMSTAANEKILIKLFKHEYPEMWNGKGFGPKDPGRNRDGTEPGPFDSEYRIIDDYAIKITTVLSGGITLGRLFREMKDQLPYVFRYEVPTAELAKHLSLEGINMDARSLFQAAVDMLGSGWKGAILSYGMVLYKNGKEYEFGEEITSRSGLVLTSV